MDGQEHENNGKCALCVDVYVSCISDCCVGIRL